MADEKPEQAAAEQPDESTPEDLLGLYTAKKAELRQLMGSVRDAFMELAPPEVRKGIHSVSGRLKDEQHLLRKIPRKRAQGRVITKSNFFSAVEDLAGVRVLTLDRWASLKPIDDFIRSKKTWEVLHEVMYAGTTDDAQMLEALGFKPDVSKRYTSSHYIVCQKGDDLVRCEIQVRGLHLEGWAEVDHQLRYPDLSPGVLTEDLLQGLRLTTLLADFLARYARDAAHLEKEAHAQREEIASLRAKLDELERRVAADEPKAAIQEAIHEVADKAKKIESDASRGTLLSVRTPADGRTLSELLRAQLVLKDLSAAGGAVGSLQAAVGAMGSLQAAVGAMGSLQAAVGTPAAMSSLRDALGSRAFGRSALQDAIGGRVLATTSALQDAVGGRQFALSNAFQDAIGGGKVAAASLNEAVGLGGASATLGAIQNLHDAGERLSAVDEVGALGGLSSALSEVVEVAPAADFEKSEESPLPTEDGDPQNS